MIIRRTHENILATISECLIAIMLITIIGVSIVRSSKTPNVYNFVELQAQFKHYMLLNKYMESKDDYIFILKNPYTNAQQKIHVAEYLYYHVYFVGDTIK